ncbi:hypothetical protein LY76DRAFT_555348 [Colletotrichum caudatum]|nr:hypothetical protein LY76DRAFT_555348 [Colletotrichum caudatum]
MPKFKCFSKLWSRFKKQQEVHSQQEDTPAQSTSFPGAASLLEADFPLNNSDRSHAKGAEITAAGDENPTDLWAQGFVLFQKRARDLAVDFRNNLLKTGNVDADADPSVSDLHLWAQPAAARLLKERESKQWSVSLFDHDIKLRDQAEKLAKLLIWSDGIVKAAVSTQPCAALAWSAVSIFLPLLTTSTKQHDALLSGFTSIIHVQLYWKLWEDDRPKNVHEDILASLADLYSHILEYQARAICHLASPQHTRAWQQVAGWNDWAKTAKNIDDLSDRCKQLISQRQKQATHRLWEQQLKEIEQSRAYLKDISQALQDSNTQRQKNLDDEKERPLLHCLEATHEVYKNFNPTRVAHTCEWFFNDDRFQRWRNETASRIIWVSAGPGCGKSVLAKALIDERRLSIRPATTTVCYFFFKEGDERRTNSYNALSAILHQLFTQSSTRHLINHAAEAFRNHGKSLASYPQLLWNILIMAARSIYPGEIVCVLDALDECNEDSRAFILTKLTDFYRGHEQLSCTLKFLVTSRPYDDLQAGFQNLALSEEYIPLDGDEKSEEIYREIGLVIDDRVDKLLADFSSDQRQQMADRLKAMENRTYLWVYLTFEIIEKNRSAYRKLSSIEQLLSEIPSKVSDAYEKILSRVQESYVKYTENLLCIVLAAARPLKLDEINYALTLQQRDFGTHKELENDLWDPTQFERVLKSLSGLFISVHQTDNTVSFIHQTAREFLKTPSRQEAGWQGRFGLPKAHGVMLRSCLGYLLLQDVAAYTETSLTTDNLKFLSYAAANWITHYYCQDEPGRNKHLGDARKLFRTSQGRVMIWATSIPYPWRSPWTDLTLASWFGLVEVVTYIVDNREDDVNSRGGYHGTAIKAASAQGHQRVVAKLLQYNADCNARGGCHPTAVLEAVSHGHPGVVQLLVDKGNQVQVTPEVLTAAASNKTRGAEIIALLLKMREKVKITEEVVVAAAGNETDGTNIITLLLEKREEEVPITLEVVETAASNETSGAEIMALLLKKREKVKITEEVVVAAAGNETAGTTIITLLLEKREEEVQLTTEVVKAAIRNWGCGRDIIALLRHKKGVEVTVTHEIMSVLTASGQPIGVFEVLLSK